MTAITVTTADFSHQSRASGNNLRNSQLRIFLIFLTTDMQFTPVSPVLLADITDAAAPLVL
jgi:hypothetical protein